MIQSDRQQSSILFQQPQDTIRKIQDPCCLLSQGTSFLKFFKEIHCVFNKKHQENTNYKDLHLVIGVLKLYPVLTMIKLN